MTNERIVDYDFVYKLRRDVSVVDSHSFFADESEPCWNDDEKLSDLCDVM